MLEKLPKKWKKRIASVGLISIFALGGTSFAKNRISDNSFEAIGGLLEEKQLSENVELNKSFDQAFETIIKQENNDIKIVDENYVERRDCYLNAAKIAILNSDTKDIAGDFDHETFSKLTVNDVRIIYGTDNIENPYTDDKILIFNKKGWYAEITNPTTNEVTNIYFDEDSIIAKYVTAVIEYENFFNKSSVVEAMENNTELSRLNQELLGWKERKVALLLLELQQYDIKLDTDYNNSGHKVLVLKKDEQLYTDEK